MTKESNFFLSYRPCSGKQKVQVADKKLTRVSGKGNVSLSLKSTLTYVLHVPKMFFFLISKKSILNEKRKHQKSVPSKYTGSIHTTFPN